MIGLCPQNRSSEIEYAVLNIIVKSIARTPYFHANGPNCMKGLKHFTLLFQ